LHPTTSRKFAGCGVRVTWAIQTDVACAARRSSDPFWQPRPPERRRRFRRYPAFFIEIKEVAMTSYVRLACVALAFAGTAAPAGAQTWIYEPDVPRARVYEPGYYYGPRAYEPPAYESRAYVPAANAAPLALTPAQRTTIYRTIIPQGRGRGPIVREQIVTEPIAPAPVVRERIAPAGSAYAYAVGSRVADAYALAPMPQAVVSTVPAVRSYRYMVINNRLLLVDPATGVVVAEVTD
jgi:hypothetical protein